jgi:transposase
LDFNSIKFTSWAGGSLKIMEEEAQKRGDYALLSLLRALKFLREERLRVIRDERECLKQLHREEIQENIQSVPGIGFRTATALQSELWEMERFQTKDQLNSYIGLAPHTFGSGEHVTVKCGNRKKKQLHYLMIEAAWRAVRYSLEYKARYGTLVGRGMSSQKAIVVIAKKLLLAIRAVWLQNRKFVNLLPESEMN